MTRIAFGSCLLLAVMCSTYAAFPASAEAQQSARTFTSPAAPEAQQSDAPASFLPVWKLLTHEQKVQFVAGYLHGWQDAARVIDIAIAYIRENQKSAVEDLEKVKTVYDLSTLRSESLVQGIDEYYADPGHSGSPLSAAVTAAKNR